MLWSTKRQETVTTLKMEAEYIAVLKAIQKAIWLLLFFDKVLLL